MQLLWLLPTLIYALIFVAQGANPAILFGMLATALLTGLIRWRHSMRVTPNEQTELRVIDGRVWLDDRKLSNRGIFWTKEQNRFIFERLAAVRATNLGRQQYDSKVFDLESELTEFVLGFDDNQVVQRQLQRDGPHAVLIGPTGAGKTVLLNHLLSSLLQFNRFELFLLDFKGGSGLESFAAFASDFQTDRDLQQAVALLSRVEAELQARETGKSGNARLLLVVDELGHLLARIPKALEVLSNISARGRAFGMHLILTNQTLVGVPRALLSNLRLRILVGDADPVDAAMLGQAIRGARLPEFEGYGQGRVVSHQNQPAPFYFALPTKPKQGPRQPSSEHLPHPGSEAFRRGYSSQAQGLRQRHRHRASRGLQLLARKAGSR